jgi:uncharacterized Zn finger protein (UPF0148 family)
MRAGETLTDAADLKAVGQIFCPLCKTKRFFLHVTGGEIEATCTECGIRLYDLTQGRLIQAQP